MAGIKCITKDFTNESNNYYWEENEIASLVIRLSVLYIYILQTNFATWSSITSNGETMFNKSLTNCHMAISTAITPLEPTFMLKKILFLKL